MNMRKPLGKIKCFDRAAHSPGIFIIFSLFLETVEMRFLEVQVVSLDPRFRVFKSPNSSVFSLRRADFTLLSSVV